MAHLLQRHPWLGICALLLGLMSGCSEEPTSTDASAPPQPTLRVLTVTSAQGEPHPAVAEEMALVRRYAEAEDLRLEVIAHQEMAALIPALLAGEGDLIVANMTVTEARSERVAFTAPVAFAREQVIARRGETLSDRQALAGRTLVARANSAYLATLERVRQLRFQPEFTIQVLPGELTDRAILNGVASGEYDLTLLDSHVAEALLAGRDDLEVAFTLSRVQPIAWAVAPAAEERLASINQFLHEHRLLATPLSSHQGDLAEIKQRGVLRVATRNSAATYFLYRGELLGFDYELVRRFAEKLGVQLQVVVPPDRAQLIEWVRDGRADLAAASLTITPERQRDGLAMTRPYNQVSELLVARAQDPIQGLDGLSGRQVAARPSSSYWGTLERLQARGLGLEPVAVAEDRETEQIIAGVAAGEYDLTLADSHIVDIELSWREDIRSVTAVGDPRQHGWLLRADNPQLLKAANRFLKQVYRGTFYNLTYQKYFQNQKHIRRHVSGRVDVAEGGALSPYDELVRAAAQRYGFDWRLLVAQMFQESRFDPQARSWVGALGLMQVMPRTAKEFGLKNLKEPATGIEAGVRYLAWLMRRFEPELDLAERTWFALASYNAGVGHVRDARKLARRMGWDADRWFGHVEKAMLMLSRKKYARRAQHGYVRGHEPVNYVRQIRDRFRAYVALET